MGVRICTAKLKFFLFILYILVKECCYLLFRSGNERTGASFWELVASLASSKGMVTIVFCFFTYCILMFINGGLDLTDKSYCFFLACL
jgi:hypothetical protein